ncbi:MAG TPA: hypothetical protein VNL16_09760 [Chloroflexota bacterium]|nr:hypothetical protein [Chloroflexota bacterium]
MPEIEQGIERIDQGGTAWDDADEVVDTTVRRPLGLVVPVRFSAETWEELRREACEIGVGPGTLIRTWVLEKLRDTQRPRKTA